MSKNRNYFTIITEKEELILNSSLRKDSCVLNKHNLTVSFKNRIIDYKNKRKYFAIVGVIEAVENDYLVVVSSAKTVGCIIDSSICQIEEVHYKLNK